MVLHEEMNHPPQHHIQESINPDRRRQDKQDLRDVITNARLILGGYDPESEPEEFPYRGHDDDPGERFVIFDALEDVDGACEAEENGEEDGGGVGGTVGPYVVGVGRVW